MQAFLNSLVPEEAATLGHLAATKPDKMRRALQAVASDIETMDTVASDISPAKEPVTDYITKIDVRCELFTKLRAMAAQQLEPHSWRDHAHATMLAVFMVARPSTPGLRGKLRNHLPTRLRDAASQCSWAPSYQSMYERFFCVFLFFLPRPTYISPAVPKGRPDTQRTFLGRSSLGGAAGEVVGRGDPSRRW
ncbi:hypothetical protein B0T25DRAFT_185606 [Lasiosphaeria hispida]|uniref:Uncharacterized protein n=1 Tax=Lasiosphaeria hispida TaxID=260671 RepID=A0AAJ0HGU8_9PEZI|nr:hypothetical protein B0T25DRAFT_185606 [Lasiosphaeria hispida]